jgi:chromosome segregation ATPase
MSMMRGSPAKAPEATNCVASEFAVSAPEPDPFSANATTYYTPQTMIPTTPPKGQTRHVRTASKEESIIFSLQTQLDLQTGLCSQFEADLRARDELVAMLGNKIAEAEEEDAKKRKFLRAWKKKVGELERTCRFLEDEIEGSRQESMERSIMDEASSEALRMLHRQIAGLERERDGWKRTEVVLREEVRRLEALAGERRNEAVRLRNSLGSLSEKQQQERVTEEALKSTVAALEKSSEEEKQRHTAVEMTWEVEMEDLRRSNLGLASELADVKQQVSARDDTIAALKTELSVTCGLADRMARSVETTEAGKCALAMERDSLKLQVVKLQAQHVAVDTAEQKALELEDDLQGLWDIKNSLEKERDQVCRFLFA